MKLKIEVLSHYLFDEKMKDLGFDDNNVEDKDIALISIIGTQECIKYWIQEDDKHYFKDHPNVLNLDFDDISDDVLYDGHHFKGFTMEQAEKTVDFIENAINKGVSSIICHCRAGMSRSRAVAEFIYRYCMEHSIDVDYDERNGYTTVLNQDVLRKLNHAYWKEHKINGYENGSEYPSDFVKPPIRVINRK